jgi:phospholipase C
MFQVSVVNRTSTIADRELHRVVRAINRQISEDFEPYWAFGGRLRVEGPAGPHADPARLKELRGDAILYVLDSTHSTSILGYHDHNLHGIPYGFVYLDLCKQLGEEWSTTLSHEALELIGDPQCNLLVQGPDPNGNDRTVYHFFEMCDAVQTQTYVIDGVTVSDFVLPNYFTPGEQPGARNDFCGTDLKSFGVASGGYIGYFDPAKGGYNNYFANDPVAQRRMRAKSAGLGRLVRRARSEGGTAAAPAAAAQPAGRMAASTLPHDPIQHIVVLMLENRSFDHMLGALRASNADIDGVDPARPGVNLDAQNGNKAYAQSPTATAYVGKDFKVPHEFADVKAQIADGMAHFVDQFRVQNPQASESEIGQIMAYFKDGDLPALHGLAKAFTVCDRWFSSMPGPTWPNRLFVHSGTSLGDVLMPDGAVQTVEKFFGKYKQDTIYDALDKAGISWKIYYGGIPQSIVLDHLKLRYFTGKYQIMDSFFEDCAGDAAAFPQYAFIEPRYFDGLHGEENDQHPPAGVLAGEQLIADVYNAIRKNPQLWESTLLIITYDEHGGFYDHVTPPDTIAPDANTSAFAFDKLGVRVPALLVSPWVAQGVDHTVYDHTSVLRYACDKWGLPPICQRTAPAAGILQIGTFAPTISQPSARTDTPAEIHAAAPSTRLARQLEGADTPFDGSQVALVSYAELMRQEHEGTPAGTKATRLAAGVAPVAQEATLAPAQRARNVEAWMEQRKTAVAAAPVVAPAIGAKAAMAGHGPRNSPKSLRPSAKRSKKDSNGASD